MDENVKAQAVEALSDMGFSLSDAVRVFLTRVALEKQFPFILKSPNVETIAAMKEADEIIEIIKTKRARFGSADEMFDDLEKNLCR
jgi:DNA-damage-inducible protein J